LKGLATAPSSVFNEELTMQIICRKKLHFQDHEIVHNSVTNEKTAILKRQTVVSPSVNPQEVPDWIKTDDLFRLCVEDGSITIVQVLSTPKKKTAANAAPKTEETKPKEADPNSGWGAKPGAGLPNGNDIGSGGTTA
jgi:hypothetical protein